MSFCHVLSEIFVLVVAGLGLVSLVAQFRLVFVSRLVFLLVPCYPGNFVVLVPCGFFF